MKKLNYTTEEILNKEFETDFKGYSAKDVDQFLDVVLEDYQTFEENLQELEKQIADLQLELDAYRHENLELRGKQKALDLTNTTAYSSVDLLKRVSRLEEEVFQNKN